MRESVSVYVCERMCALEQVCECVSVSVCVCEKESVCVCVC